MNQSLEKNMAVADRSRIRPALCHCSSVASYTTNIPVPFRHLSPSESEPVIGEMQRIFGRIFEDGGQVDH